MNLADFGFGFVKVKAHDKRPIGQGWQKTAYTADEARAHYLAGGNVGVHAGELSNGIIWIDVDRGRTLDQFLATFPELTSSLRVYRDNAPGRGKVAIRIVDRIPSPTKWKAAPTDKSPSTELLSTGNQAVVWGTHPSGARYQLAGETVVEMSYAELSALWQRWTGRPLTENPTKRPKRQAAPEQPHYTPQDPDNLIEQVKAAWPILGVLQRFGLASHGTEEERNGETRVLGNGGLLISKDGALWSIPNNGQGFGGNVFHAWFWAKHQRLVDFRTDKAAFRETLLEMAEAAGLEIPKSAGVVDPEEVRTEVAALRAWVKSTSFSDLVPKEMQSAVGYRTDGTDTKIAHAVLDECHERGTWRIYVSRRKLAIRAGLGSHETAQKALNRLSGWFVTLHDDGAIELAARRSTTSLSVPLVEDLVVDLRAANYGEMMGDDVFLTGASKAAKNRVNRDARRVERMMVDAGDMTPEEAAAVAWFKEMWAATESGLGEAGARMIDAILTHGDMTRAELVSATGKTKSAVGRITLRLERLGLLVAEQESSRSPKVYCLASEWAARLDRLRPTLKTHKLGAERRKRNEEQLIGYCDRELKRKNVDEDRRRSLARRRARAEKRLAELVAELHEGADVDRWVTTASATNPRFDHAPIMQERRQERYLAATEALSDLVQPDRLLWRDELAKARALAGVVGVNLADYVDSQSLQMAAD